MRRRHMIDIVNDEMKSFCGHEMTLQEYRFAVKRMPEHINCKRCLEKYEKYLKVWDETLDQLLS